MLKILFTTGSKSTVTYRTEIFNITVTLGDKILFSYNNPVHLSYSYKYVGRLLDSFLSKNLINSKLLHPHPHPHPLHPSLRSALRRGQRVGRSKIRKDRVFINNPLIFFSLFISNILVRTEYVLDCYINSDITKFNTFSVILTYIHLLMYLFSGAFTEFIITNRYIHPL